MQLHDFVEIHSTAKRIVSEFITKLENLGFSALPPILRLDVGNGGIYEVETQASIVYPAMMLRGIDDEKHGFFSSLRKLVEAGYLSTLLRAIDTPEERQKYEEAARIIGSSTSLFTEKACGATKTAWLSGATTEVYEVAIQNGWQPVSQPPDRRRWVDFTGGHVVTKPSDLEDLLDAAGSTGACIKPVYGTCARSVEVWPARKMSGASTKRRLLRKGSELIASDGAVFLQPFIPPFVRDGWRGIWRVYIFYDPTEKEYRATTWFYNERRGTLRIHGASDAKFYLGV